MRFLGDTQLMLRQRLDCEVSGRKRTGPSGSSNLRVRVRYDAHRILLKGLLGPAATIATTPTFARDAYLMMINDIVYSLTR